MKIACEPANGSFGLAATLLSVLIRTYLERIGAIGFALQHYGLENLRDLLPFATLGTLTSFPGGGAEISPMSLTTLLCAGYGVGAALLTGLRLSHADL